MPQRFPPASRLRRQSEFSGVFDGGVKRHGRLMTVFVRSGPAGHARLGIAASKKLGNAVVRNKAKRRVRELFRQATQPTGLDIVVIPRRPMLDAPFASVQREFESLVDWAVRHGRGTSSTLPPAPVADRRL